MINGGNNMDKQLARQQYEQEKITKELQDRKKHTS